VYYIDSVISNFSFLSPTRRYVFFPGWYSPTTFLFPLYLDLQCDYITKSVTHSLFSVAAVCSCLFQGLLGRIE
jgi:hypothetical protein